MQKNAPFPLDVFPRNSLYFPRLNFFQPARDFILPRGIHIRINGRVQTGDQVSGQFGSFLFGKGQSLLEQFVSLLRHE